MDHHKEATQRFVRLRRLRRSRSLRQLAVETRLSPDRFIQPLFVTPGTGIRKEIPSLPCQPILSVDQLQKEGEDLLSLGVGAILLFGHPTTKDEWGSGAHDPDGTVQQAIRVLKRETPDLTVISDVCLCQYTNHGHCGIVVDREIDDDRTLPILARTAISHAEAGADIVAPSDMMDGRVAAIRGALDQAGHVQLPIASYSAKYASAFYNPFRDAAESAPQFGNRLSYQMDPANGREALREIATDIDEGADIVIVKPALAYLDVISHARARFDVPIAAYAVSGEYAMIKAASARGWINERQATLEILTGIVRAGANLVITYHAKEAARWIA